MTALLSVVEVDPFPAFANSAGLTERERADITVFLATWPDAGTVVPGTGGLRKLRWQAPGRGKRGGYRVLYYFYDRDVPVFLFAIFTKNQQADLNPEQKRRVSASIDKLKTWIKADRDAKRTIER